MKCPDGTQAINFGCRPALPIAEYIEYYPITKLVFDQNKNFLGTGKLVPDGEGFKIKITKY